MEDIGQKLNKIEAIADIGEAIATMAANFADDTNTMRMMLIDLEAKFKEISQLAANSGKSVQKTQLSKAVA